jgi:DNA-binding transcriptional regulator YiaG
MKIGANVKFYNYEMRAAREKLKMSQTKLAYLVGCDVHIINYMSALKKRLDKIGESSV